MSDKTTDTLVRMMQATFDAAPAAPSLSAPVSRRPGRHQSLLVATGAFVVVLLVVGTGIVLLRPAGSTSGEVAAPPGGLSGILCKRRLDQGLALLALERKRHV